MMNSKISDLNSLDCEQLIMSMPILNNQLHAKSSPVPGIAEWQYKEREDNAKFDMLILAQAGVINSEELLSLYKMAKSPDRENLIVAEEIIKNKLNGTEHDTIQSKG